MEIVEKQDDRPLGTTVPAILNHDGAEEWRRVWKQLGKMRILSDADRQNLMLYCLAYQDLIKYSRDCNKGADVFETEKGYKVKSPEATLKREAAELMLKVSKEFGLTPQARKKMELLEKEAEDEFSAFLKAGKRKA